MRRTPRQTVIGTNNAEVNAPILSINARSGFMGQVRDRKFARLFAGGRWIRTSGSSRDKASVPRFRLGPPSLISTNGSRRIERRRHAPEAVDDRLRPPLHGARNRKFESSSLQQKSRANHRFPDRFARQALFSLAGYPPDV